MAGRVKVIGVHAVPADEPVHLVEIEVEGATDAFDFGAVTQALPGVPRENWQAAYDEREVGSTEGKARFAFFFHHLDLKRSLITPYGSVALPQETPVPPHLSGIEYEAP